MVKSNKCFLCKAVLLGMCIMLSFVIMVGCEFFGGERIVLCPTCKEQFCICDHQSFFDPTFVSTEANAGAYILTQSGLDLYMQTFLAADSTGQADSIGSVDDNAVEDIKQRLLFLICQSSISFGGVSMEFEQNSCYYKANENDTAVLFSLDGDVLCARFFGFFDEEIDLEFMLCEDIAVSDQPAQKISTPTVMQLIHVLRCSTPDYQGIQSISMQIKSADSKKLIDIDSSKLQKSVSESGTIYTLPYRDAKLAVGQNSVRVCLRGGPYILDNQLYMSLDSNTVTIDIGVTQKEDYMPATPYNLDVSNTMKDYVMWTTDEVFDYGCKAYFKSATSTQFVEVACTQLSSGSTNIFGSKLKSLGLQVGTNVLRVISPAPFYNIMLSGGILTTYLESKPVDFDIEISDEVSQPLPPPTLDRMILFNDYIYFAANTIVYLWDEALGYQEVANSTDMDFATLSFDTLSQGHNLMRIVNSNIETQIIDGVLVRFSYSTPTDFDLFVEIDGGVTIIVG